MSSQKRNNPKTVVAMTVATVVGVSYALWSIKNALASPPPEPVSQTSAPSSAETTVSEAAESQPKSALSSAPSDNDRAATEPREDVNLARNADPFKPMASLAPPRVAATPTPPLQTGASKAALPNLQVVRSVALPTFPGAGNRQEVGPGPTIEPIAKPELVGTLLGERPCAVFRANKQLAVVPEGKMFGFWKVVSVSHGGVMVKSGNRTLRLGVGTYPQPKATPESSQPPTGTLQQRQYVPQVILNATTADAPGNETPR